MNGADPFSIRRAQRDDAAEIARLFLISSDGLAAYIWSRLADAGQPIAEVGKARYAREGVAFSYENCLLASCEGKTLGMVHAFEMPAIVPNAAEADPVLAPYAELEDAGSLYISGLAVHEPYRGLGIGSRLLDCIGALAVTQAIPRLSLICFERNSVARDFYLRRGFRIADRRPVVPHPALHHKGGDALLMVCPVPGGGVGHGKPLRSAPRMYGAAEPGHGMDSSPMRSTVADPDRG